MTYNLKVDLRQLKTFLTTADCGSFSRASEKLYIAQPALSRQIRMLEDSLNVKVFLRHGRGVVLTAAGELLYEKSQELFRNLEQTQAEVTAMSGEVTGTVILGVLPTITESFTGAIIEKCRMLYPQINLVVRSAQSSTLQQMIMQHRVDIAVLYQDTNHKSITYNPLLEENLCLIAPNNSEESDYDEITLDHVLQLPLILAEEKYGFRDRMEKLAAQKGQELKIVLEVSAWPTLTDTVRRGLGYTILSPIGVHGSVDRGEVSAIPIVDPEIKRTVAVATPTDMPASIATLKMGEIIRMHFLELASSKFYHGLLKSTGNQIKV